MPSQKRERKRAGRDARREAALAAQRRAAQRNRIVAIVVVVALVVGGLLLFAAGGDDDAERVTATGDTTTTASGETTTSEAGETTTTAAGAKDPFAGADGTAACPPADGSAERRTKFDGAPRKCIDLARQYAAVVDTDVGTFRIELHPAKAPVTVNNFVFLARYHYYDGVPFHRVVPGFVVQGGDGEKGNGTGGPGYTIAEEPPAQGEYKIGSVAMAKTAQPHSTGSQFFVITGEQGASLPPQYSLFGTVTEGMDVVKRIEADGAPDPNPPKVVHRITKVTIVES